MITNIQNTIDQLRHLNYINVINQWHFYEGKLSQFPNNNEITNWPIAAVNEKEYIVWESGKKNYWLAQYFTIPNHLNRYSVVDLSLRLCLTWWAENAEVFVNGKLIQEGDLFDSSARILLTSQAIPNDTILVVIRLVSPGHDIGALMRSHLVYESSEIDPGFFADELTILNNYLTEFEPEKIAILNQEINNLAWDNLDNRELFNQSIIKLRQTLKYLATNLKKRHFYMLGHAHLDMAWLWSLNETYIVAQRTFNSVLNLQQEYPNLTFCHTTPALYNWIEENQPNLFKSIQNSVALNKWEVLGGMWVEPEVNLISGESLIRQLLYGQYYIKEKFGKFTKIGWLPDSFGFPWTLPQIFQQAGIDYFVTGKLHWNDTNKFPHGCFWWQSPDGTKILTLMSPPNLTGVMDTNPITMTNYAINWEKQTNLQDIFWLPGVGDHGGGPTRDMLDVASKWHNSPFFPSLQFSTANNYLEKISKTKNLPVWNQELYLELHRGCYTTHAEQKKANRYCENLLYQAELFACLSYLIQKKNHFEIKRNNNLKYQIEQAWKAVLFNQFHDILPGTSITEVFEEANQDWAKIIETGEKILQDSLQEIASQINLPQFPYSQAKPLVIFNPTNWTRSEIISINLKSQNFKVYDLDGNQVAQQISSDDKLLFLAENIPSIGYRLYWLVESEQLENKILNQTNNFILANELLKVTIDKNTGELSSIWDTINQKEILASNGNQLQFFTDKGQYWDAWNINPNYEKYPLPSAELHSIEWLEKGSLKSAIRVTKKFGQSEFIQDYILEKNSPILKVANIVNWQETHVLVKAAFPLNLDSNYATYEIACGAIERTTKPETKEEKAQWEVFAHRWADVFDNNCNYGVSLLNDCKYGYDIRSNTMRLSLLRSPQWPDKNADQGIHHFTYALYPHKGTWQEAKTVRYGYELNLPLLLVFIQNNLSKSIAPIGKLLDLGNNSLIIMALKFAENNSDNLILRCYESEGKSTELFLQSDFNLSLKKLVNLLEIENSNNVKESIVKINPWEIKSYLI